MASDIDICNLALSRLGEEATVASIDPPEGSIQSEHCAMFYPIARDSLLEMHPWSFATRRMPLAQLDINSYGWTYAYMLPDNVVRVLSVLDQSSNGADIQDFAVESEADGTRVVLTNQPNAVMRYVAREFDTAKYPPLFVDALSWLLASHLAGVVIKGQDGSAHAQRCMQFFSMTMQQAVLSDINQQQETLPTHSVGWMSARG